MSRFKANNIEIPVLPFDRLETKLTLDKGTLRLQPAVIRVGQGTAANEPNALWLGNSRQSRYRFSDRAS